MQSKSNGMNKVFPRNFTRRELFMFHLHHSIDRFLLGSYQCGGERKKEIERDGRNFEFLLGRNLLKVILFELLKPSFTFIEVHIFFLLRNWLISTWKQERSREREKRLSWWLLQVKFIHFTTQKKNNIIFHYFSFSLPLPSNDSHSQWIFSFFFCVSSLHNTEAFGENEGMTAVSVRHRLFRYVET